MKNETIAHLYPTRYILNILLYFWMATYDIMLKLSAFLSYVEVATCVKFPISSFKGYIVGIFRIKPITLLPF